MMYTTFPYSDTTLMLERRFRDGSASREELADSCYVDRCAARGLTVAEDLALRAAEREALREAGPALAEENARLRRQASDLLGEVCRLRALLSEKVTP